MCGNVFFAEICRIYFGSFPEGQEEYPSRSSRCFYKTTFVTGGRVGLGVRALAFHHCGPGSISALGVVRGSSLLVLYSAMRGFSPGTPVFLSHQKPTFD